MIYLFLFAFLWSSRIPCASMDAPIVQIEQTSLVRVKAELAEKAQAYKDYVDDQVDYWEHLKTEFDPKVVNNVDNYLDRLNLLNKHDKNLCQKNLLELSKDSQTRRLPVETKRQAIMTIMVKHFDQKINLLTQSVKGYDIILKTLGSQDINQLFLAELCMYGSYMLTRFTGLMTNDSPVFSAFIGLYDDYNRRRIENEITKFDIMIDFILSIYPFVDHSNPEIQKLLSYFPVLSSLIENSYLAIDLDSFCLDGIMFGNTGRFSVAPADVEFTKRTTLPIVDLGSLQPLDESTLKKNESSWNEKYKELVQKYSPKPKTVIQEQKTQQKSRKEKQVLTPSRKQKSRKKNIPEQKTTTPSPQGEKKGEGEGPGISTPDTNATESMKEEEKETISTIPQIPLEAPSVMPATPTTPKKTGNQKRREKQARRAEERKNEFTALNSGVHMPEEKLHHPMLDSTDIISLNRAHYNIIHDLLRNDLSKTTRYEEIISALESLGIKIITRGNGDYRTLLLPNGRRIFIYRPAVPQVGSRFLKKLREELPLKWGLTVDNLR